MKLMKSDERGITLQAVILSAVLALGASGAGIVTFNVIADETTDIVEVGSQTLDPFYEEEAENPFWEYEESSAVDNPDPVDPPTSTPSTTSTSTTTTTSTSTTTTTAPPTDPPIPEYMITVGAYTSNVESLVAYFKVTEEKAIDVLVCISVFIEIAEGDFNPSDVHNSIFDIYRGYIENYPPLTLVQQFDRYRNDWADLGDIDEENKEPYAFLRCIEIALSPDLNPTVLNDVDEEIDGLFIDE